MTHVEAFAFVLPPHLNAQINLPDPPVWINGCISSTENCQYLPRPPQNWTHK